MLVASAGLAFLQYVSLWKIIKSGGKVFLRETKKKVISNSNRH